VRQSNGQSRVYVRQASPRKQIVKKSQKNNRRVAARRHLAAECAVKGSGRNYVAGGGSDFGTVAVGVPGAASLSLREQVGLVFELGVSWSCHKALRMTLGGSKCGLTRRHVLHDTKRKIAASPAKEVLVTNTGAHLANLSLAVQERVTALCDADHFVERFVYGSGHRPCGQWMRLYSTTLTREPGAGSPHRRSPTST